MLIGACTTELQKSQASPPPTGSEFSRDLSNYYRASAQNQWDGQTDFQASERFARKSMASGRGETVQPDNVGWGAQSLHRGSMAASQGQKLPRRLRLGDG